MAIRGPGDPTRPPGGPRPVDKTGEVQGGNRTTGPQQAGAAPVGTGSAESIDLALATTQADLKAGRIPRDLAQVTRRFVDHYVEQRFGHLVQGPGRDAMARAMVETIHQDAGLKERLHKVVNSLLA